MFWVITIIVGLLVGLVARFLLPGRDPIGIIATMLIGVAGVLIGTWLWEEVLFKNNNDNEGFAIFAGVVVTMIILWVIRKMSYGRTGRRAAY
jgi:uncharacterized membrane protein YeaQ/YmgE (transglycosylase-associated protein family)